MDVLEPSVSTWYSRYLTSGYDRFRRVWNRAINCQSINRQNLHWQMCETIQPLFQIWQTQSTIGYSGDDDNPMIWRDIWTGEGTTGIRMIEFVWRIIYDIDSLDKSDRRFCFIMDNLRSHHNQQMAAIIIEAGHRIVFRASYWPVDGLIEYMFNTIQGVLRIRNHLISDAATL